MVAKISTLVVRRVNKMRSEIEKATILQAFCDRFVVTKIEGKRILEQCEYEPFIAEKMMMTYKNKIEQPHKNREITKKDLDKRLHRLDMIDSSEGITNPHSIFSRRHMLEVALKSTNPKTRKAILRAIDTEFLRVPRKKSPQRKFLRWLGL